MPSATSERRPGLSVSGSTNISSREKRESRIVDYEPEEIIEKDDSIGSNDAQAIAKSLDDAAVTYGCTHGVGMESAYDRVRTHPRVASCGSPTTSS
jgi:hypothetical protein